MGTKTVTEISGRGENNAFKPIEPLVAERMSLMTVTTKEYGSRALACIRVELIATCGDEVYLASCTVVEETKQAAPDARVHDQEKNIKPDVALLMPTSGSYEAPASSTTNGADGSDQKFRSPPTIRATRGDGDTATATKATDENDDTAKLGRDTSDAVSMTWNT